MYTFPNGKRYIGATKRTLAQRQGRDWNRYKLNRLLWPAIQEYGIENIKTDILFEGDVPDETAGEMERFYIAEYKTNANRYNNPSYGYNLGDGGEGVHDRHLSEERKQQLREQVLVLQAHNRLRPVSEETRRRQSEARKGKHFGPMSPEAKAKLSKANSRENMTWETHLRRSRASKKKTVMEDSEGNITIFDCRQDVAARFGVSCATVSRWINGTRSNYNGYKFYDYSPTTTEREGLREA